MLFTFNPYLPGLPSAKRLHNYGKSPCVMGKSTISMAMVNSYDCLPDGKIVNTMKNELLFGNNEYVRRIMNCYLGIISLPGHNIMIHSYAFIYNDTRPQYYWL